MSGGHVRAPLGAVGGRARYVGRVAPFLVVLTLTFGVSREAAAHCDAARLCPGAGACTINVTGQNTKIDNGCELNFDGRDVTLDGTLDIDGNAVTIRARNFTVAPGGLIDGSPQGGFIMIFARGGNIVVQTSAQRGIDVIGQDQGGAIVLDATGDVLIHGRLKVNNSTTAPEASGGSIELRAGGNVRISSSSDVDASGGQEAEGGIVDLLAAGRIDIEQKISAVGGDGGEVTIEAGGEIFLNHRIDDDSVSGGGYGGVVDIAAESTVTVGQPIRSRGSTSTDDFGGDGGSVSVFSAAGDVVVRSEITVQSGAPDGYGGEIEFFAGRSVQLQGGSLNASGADGIDTSGFTVILDADVDIRLGAPIDVSGGYEGGAIEIAAGRNVEIASTLDVRARQPAFAGSVIVDAGVLTAGGVTLKAGATQSQAGRILAGGVTCSQQACSIAGTIDVTACDVTLEGRPTPTAFPGMLDASAPGASGEGGAIVVTARRRLTLGTGATIDATGAGSQGRVELAFPSSQPPFSGGITPAPLQTRCNPAECPGTGRCRMLCTDLCECGDGGIDPFEQCDTTAQGCGVGLVCGVTGTSRECACIATCGNGAVDDGEQCDGTQGGTTCRALGFADTDPVPCLDCAFDTSVCEVGSCGDGVRVPRNELEERGLPGSFEVCDGADLGGETCVSRGYTRGTLACKANCSGFDVSACQFGRCGDGIPDAGEECDQGALNSNAPNAACRTNCRVPRCGDAITDTALGEQCDDANALNTDRCVSGCRQAACGDGFVCSNLACTTGPTGGREECDATAVCCVACGKRACADGMQCGSIGSNGCCHPGTCVDSDPCTTNGQCAPETGCTYAPVPNCCTALGDARCNDTNPCTTDQCNVGTMRCEHVANTLACNDGNACTQGDVCAGGACGGTAVTCVPPDECREVVGCNPATGCEFRLIPGCCLGEGLLCEDGNACTQGDTCSGGTCVGGPPVQCPVPDQCHDAGTCNPATGQCSNPAKANGTGCVDGNACTQADTCQAGTCVGANPVQCPLPDQCHDAGTCNLATGQCSNPVKPDGARCDDGNACTQEDTCQVGVCAGASPVVCTALDECHAPGTCDPATGDCPDPTRPDGTPCSDGDACTASDACRAGACVGAAIVCDDGNPCTDDRCAGGSCVQESNDALCNDDDPCTAADQCRDGQCSGAFGLGADIVCGSQSLLATPCGTEPIPASLLKFIEGKVNAARKLLQKADAAAAQGKDTKIPKLRAKAVKTLEKISKKVAKAMATSKPDQDITAACGAQIDALLQHRKQLITAFVF